MSAETSAIDPTMTTAAGAGACGAAVGEIPVAAMENLAARCRAGGFFLLALRCDGSVAFHDAGADPFFHRYVMPVLEIPEPLSSLLRSKASLLTPLSNVTVWDIVPGVVVAAAPYVYRKRMTGVLVLCAKSPKFKLDEDVLRLCSRVGVDAMWLKQQADALPAMDEHAVQRQPRLLMNMLRDQVRISDLEHELESVSTQLSNTYEELSLIYQLNSGMRVNRSPVEFFKQACTDVLELMSVRGMGVGLRGESGLVEQPILYGVMALPPAILQRLADELLVFLRDRQQPLLIHHLAKDKYFHWMSAYAQQLVAVPLQRQDQTLGVLFAIDKQTDEFDTVDCKLLSSIANESAIYLENSMLFEDVRGLLMGLLHSLVSAVDAKDAYTCGHSERVALLSRFIAQEIRLGDQMVERIYMAGLLHDVGKIGVPEAVLQKPGRLTPEEFEQIKKHPEIGARILHDIRQIQDIIPGVMYHHERYDGRGYPAGLAGEDIPLMGRIICLADCFDAMTSSRTYRKAMPLEVAMTEIRRCSGTQFDPGLTDAFLSVGVERFRELLTDHKRQTKHLIEMQQNLRAA